MRKKEQRIPLYKIVWCKMRYYQQLNNIPDDTLATALEVHNRTLRTYDKDASNITIGRIDKFLDMYNITLDELLNS